MVKFDMEVDVPEELIKDAVLKDIEILNIANKKLEKKIKKLEKEKTDLKNKVHELEYDLEVYRELRVMIRDHLTLYEYEDLF